MKQYSKISDTEAAVTNTQVVTVSANDLKSKALEIEKNIQSVKDRAEAEKVAMEKNTAQIFDQLMPLKEALAQVIEELAAMKAVGVAPAEEALPEEKE